MSEHEHEPDLIEAKLTDGDGLVSDFAEDLDAWRAQSHARLDAVAQKMAARGTGRHRAPSSTRLAWALAAIAVGVLAVVALATWVAWG